MFLQLIRDQDWSINVLKYSLGCIVCISNGSLNQIWFILAHVICTVVTHVPVSIYALVGEIKQIYFIYLFIRISSGEATIKSFWHKLYCNMKVIPQCKVIGPNDRIKHNI